MQCDILFRLAAAAPVGDWRDAALRPGALFMAGDPKQAIYRFRGADAGTYAEAREVVRRAQPDGVLPVTANFRSRPAILGHVNRCFRAPLSRAARQPYVELSPTLDEADHGLPSVARLTVRVPPPGKVGDVREAEAEAVASLCSALLGGLSLRGRNGTRRLRPGDIALLTPAATDLWIYERAMEDAGIPIASQAGKGFHRRQETQDLLALARVLADPRDTLAFGALMRGPLVGLTDEALLDVVEGLPAAPDGQAARFDVRTPPEQVGNPLARNVLQALQALRRKAPWTTPAQILSEAIERLDIRPILFAREPYRRQGALANVDEFLERARRYAVRGLGRFVRDLGREWREGARHREGLPDAGDDAVCIMSVHGAKGLEWPVVVPINTASQFRPRDPFVHRASDQTLHWLLGDVVPPALADAVAEEREGEGRERERLWYVACTRARDLLVLPSLPEAIRASWARVVDLEHGLLPELDASSLPRHPFSASSEPPNTQTAEAFAAEDAAVAAASPSLAWITPSDADDDRAPHLEPSAAQDLPDIWSSEDVIGAGRVRGLVLHKLLEEMMLGELPAKQDAMEGRARELLERLPAPTTSGASPEAGEMARTALEATRHPEVAPLWTGLVPEAEIYSTVGSRPLAGRADAVCLDAGKVTAVLDWKSDVAPSEEERSRHRRQLELYLASTGAQRGALVYLSAGVVEWIPAQSTPAAPRRAVPSAHNAPAGVDGSPP